MQAGSRARGAVKGKTRYVFAGTGDHDAEERTKTCPRCGQVLFADMDVCYGCLYDFSRDHHGAADGRIAQERALRERLKAIPAVRDPLDTIELDEIDDDEDEQKRGQEQELRVPRHRRETQGSPSGTPDDTLDLSPARAVTELQAEGGAGGTPLYALVVSTDDLLVRVPLGERPVTVGRDEANDIVLRNRAVSRKHVRVTCEDGVVRLVDCGATNPARLRGAPVDGEVILGRGDTVDVCGTQLTIA